MSNLQVIQLSATDLAIENFEPLDRATELFDLYRQFYGKESNKFLVKDYLKQRLLNNQSIIFLGLIDGNIVGFMQLYPSFSSLSLSPILVLNDLFVVEDFRNCGVAKTLINHAKDLAMNSKISRISLNTAKNNDLAIKLYQKLGFVLDCDFLTYNLSLNG